MSNFGQWVTVPASMTSSGKPERRFKMKSGEYRLTEPGTNEAISHSLGSLHRGVYDFLAAHGGDPSTNPGDLSPRTPSGLTAEQQKSLIEGTEGATARVARIKAESDALVDAARKDPSHQYHKLFQQAPVVLADDVDARDSSIAVSLKYAPGADLWASDAGKEMIQPLSPTSTKAMLLACPSTTPISGRSALGLCRRSSTRWATQAPWLSGLRPTPHWPCVSTTSSSATPTQAPAPATKRSRLRWMPATSLLLKAALIWKPVQRVKPMAQTASSSKCCSAAGTEPSRDSELHGFRSPRTGWQENDW